MLDRSDYNSALKNEVMKKNEVMAQDVCMCITILRKVVSDILLDKVIFEQRPKGVEISYVSIWKNISERGNSSVQRPQNHVIAIRCPINSLDVNRSSSKCFPVFLWFPLREGLTGVRRGILPGVLTDVFTRAL